MEASLGRIYVLLRAYGELVCDGLADNPGEKENSEEERHLTTVNAKHCSKEAAQGCCNNQCSIEKTRQARIDSNIKDIRNRPRIAEQRQPRRRPTWNRKV